MPYLPRLEKTSSEIMSAGAFSTEGYQKTARKKMGLN